MIDGPGGFEGPYDEGEFLDRIEGDRELGQEIMQMFLGQCPGTLSDIGEALNSGDLDSLGRLAHSIKGTVGIFGARDSVSAALELETAARDGITIHSNKYYRDLFETVLDGYEDVTLRVYFARHDGDTLAAIIVLFYREEATYLYGASTGKKRNLMPAYALQWQAIRDAKEAGCLRYDFYGIPPSDDPTHPMHGLYRFKTGFGGRVVHRTGSLDMPLKHAHYQAYSLAEWFRLVWFKKLRKLLRKGIPANS